MRGSRRRIAAIKGIVPVDSYETAAQALVNAGERVLILTGYLIPETMSPETDGLLGAFFLSEALEKIGKKSFIITDQPHYNCLKKAGMGARCVDFPIGHPDSPSQAADFLRQIDPAVVISIERPGPDRQGRNLTARSLDITGRIAPLELLFQAPLTIGIGDGGNELGLGVFYDHFPSGTPACFIPSDQTLIGATSNWAAYGLIAAMECQLKRDDLLPHPDEEIQRLMRLVDAGAVDGMTCRPVPAVDGFTADQNRELLSDLSECVRSYLEYSDSLALFLAEQSSRYDVLCAELRVGIDFEAGQPHVTGIVALDRQLQELDSFFKERRLNPDFRISVLSRWPEQIRFEPAGMKTLTGQFFSPAAYPVDLFEKPVEGSRRATEMIQDDTAGRCIWKVELKGRDWYLIQTPDLAMGWTSFSDWSPVEMVNVRRTWMEMPRTRPGDIVGAGIQHSTFRDLAMRQLGLPYRWGGRSSAGLDCSGLTQLVFRAIGILLPRHSSDQRRHGVRVPMKNARSADLVFASHEESALSHVGLVLDDGILHACRSKKKVVFETVEKFSIAYRITAVRRCLDLEKGFNPNDTNRLEESS